MSELASWIVWGAPTPHIETGCRTPLTYRGVTSWETILHGPHISHVDLYVQEPVLPHATCQTLYKPPDFLCSLIHHSLNRDNITHEGEMRWKYLNKSNKFLYQTTLKNHPAVSLFGKLNCWEALRKSSRWICFWPKPFYGWVTESYVSICDNILVLSFQNLFQTQGKWWGQMHGILENITCSPISEDVDFLSHNQ